jgi:YgiT-type zinc finger domain-containing protein
VIPHQRCACGGTFEEHMVTATFKTPEGDVQIQDVPQGRCPMCGSRVYPSRVLARIECAYKAELPPED